MPAPVRLPTAAEIDEAGELVLEQLLGRGWEGRLQAGRLDALLSPPIDHAWVQRRIAKLKPMSDGPMYLVPKVVWDLSTALAQPDWFELWQELALRCPREWLVRFCGVAVLQSPAPRPRGRRSRSRVPQDALRIDSRRMQSLLSLGVLAWMLCEYDPSNPRYPYVIRGLPYGAWQYLVAYWQRYADRQYLRVPGSTTLFGTYEGGGRWDCGYIAAWCQAGIAIRYQPSSKDAPDGMAGKWRKNKRGEWERWAFVEVRLRIEAPHLAPIATGPSPTGWRKPAPPPPTGELDALVTEGARSWYPDEERATADGAAPANAGEADCCNGLQEPAREARAASSAPTTTADEQTLHEPKYPVTEGPRSPEPSTPARALPASAALELGAQVDDLERAGYADTADRDGGPDEADSDAAEISTQTASSREETTYDPAPDAFEFWRAPEPTPTVDEPTSLEVTERAARELVQSLRSRRAGHLPARPGADVVAACTLEEGGVQAPPSDKFLAAMDAYYAEKERRERSRAEQRKRKPPW